MGIEPQQELHASSLDIPNLKLGWNGRRNGGPANLLLDEEQWEHGFHVERLVVTIVALHQREIPVHEASQHVMEASLAGGSTRIEHEVVLAFVASALGERGPASYLHKFAIGGTLYEALGHQALSGCIL